MEEDMHKTHEVLEQLVSGQQELERKLERLHADVQRLFPRAADEIQVEPHNLGFAELKGVNDMSQGNEQLSLFDTSEKSTITNTRSRRTERLRRTLATAENSVKKQRRLSFTSSAAPGLGRSKTEKEFALEVAMIALIAANLLFIGLSMDFHEEGRWSVWNLLDILFSVLFLTELVLRIRLHGFLGYCTGPDACSNIFDMCLIVLDTLQLILDAVLSNSGYQNLPAMSLFRVVRLTRLVRVVRLAKSTLFADMQFLLSGIVKGMKTLVYTSCIFLVAVYLLGLFARELLGRGRLDESTTYYFSNVPRSMITVFRCTLSDCNTSDGKSIFERVFQELGEAGFVFAIIWTIFLILVVFGLFNVISAIFLEVTVSAAEMTKKKKLLDRLEDKELWSKSLATFLKRVIVEIDPGMTVDEPGFMVSAVEEIAGLIVSREALSRVCKHDMEAKAALSAMDIDPEDQQKLADIVDANQRGETDLLFVINGLARLRGVPRRSDIISVELVVQALLQNFEQLNRSLSRQANRGLVRSCDVRAPYLNETAIV